MKTPIFVRPLSEEERESLKKGLRSKDTFTMRRAQMLLASSRGERAPKIAKNLGCASQTVRDAIHDFNERGLHALERSPRAPRGPATPSTEERRGLAGDAPPLSEGVRIPDEPVDLAMAAEAAFEEGLTEERVSGETIRATLSRLLGVRWMRAKRWITSPDPLYERKKGRRDRLMEVAGADPEWAVGFEDECWWSRVALPTLNAWTEEGKPPRLIQRSVAKDDPEPKAISCYGLYLPELDETWLRFVDGRPVSSITTRFLEWCCEKLEALGKKVCCSSGTTPPGMSPKRSGGGSVPTTAASNRAAKWGEDRELPASEAESVAERHRAEMGSRQAKGGRGRRASRSVRACRQSLPGFRLSAPRASHHSTEGRLIMH